MLPEEELARPEAEQVPASIRHHFEPRRDSERRLLRGMWRRGRCKLLNHLARLEVEMRPLR
jgi:hypothetical protein